MLKMPRFRGRAVMVGLMSAALAGGPARGDARAAPPTDAPPTDAPRAADAPVIDLEPFVVTPTRGPRRVSAAPSLTEFIGTRDLERFQPRTLPETMHEIPGVMVQKTGHGQGSPFVRGFTGFRTLALIDGVRLNNSVFRDGPNQYWNTVDPWSIGAIELVKGPGSVLHGSDAIGGTLAVTSRRPRLEEGAVGLRAGGRIASRSSTAERSHVVRGELELVQDGWIGLRLGGTLKHFGDLQTGGGRAPWTGYDEADLDAVLEVAIDRDVRLILGHQRVDQDDAWRTHKTIVSQSFAGTTVGTERRRVLWQNRELSRLTLEADRLGGLVDSAVFTLSHHGQSERQDRVRADGRRDLQGFEVDTLGLRGQFRTASDLGRWTWGFEYDRDEVDSYRLNFATDGSFSGASIQGPVADDASYDLLGIYLQHESRLARPLELVLGARWTWARVDADRVLDPVGGGVIAITDEFDALVGSARMIWWLDAAERANLFAGVSQGFRAPNLSDLTRLDTARTDEIETPSPGLDAERFTTIEAGLRSRTEQITLEAAWYWTTIDGPIIRQPTGAIVDGDREVVKRNGGDGFVHGVELAAGWRFAPGWTLEGTLAWMDGRLDTYPTSDPVLVTESLDRLMPLTGTIGLRWEDPEARWWAESRVVLAARADRLSTRDRADTERIPPEGTPGYATLGIRGGWRVDERMSLTVALENMTDANYRVHGSGVNEPGINLVLGLEVRF